MSQDLSISDEESPADTDQTKHGSWGYCLAGLDFVTGFQSRHEAEAELRRRGTGQTAWCAPGQLTIPYFMDAFLDWIIDQSDMPLSQYFAIELATANWEDDDKFSFSDAIDAAELDSVEAVLRTALAAAFRRHDGNKFAVLIENGACGNTLGLDYEDPIVGVIAKDDELINQMSDAMREWYDRHEMEKKIDWLHIRLRKAA